MAGISQVTYVRDSSKDILEPTQPEEPVTPPEPSQPESTQKYISKISDGTNTYVIKDAEARAAKKVTTLASSGTISLADNSINRIKATGAVTFKLPTVSDATVFHQILVQLTMSAVQTINLGTTVYFNSSAPDLSSAGSYNIIFEHDGLQWVAGSMFKGNV